MFRIFLKYILILCCSFPSYYPLIVCAQSKANTSGEKAYKKLYDNGAEALSNGKYNKGNAFFEEAIALGRVDWKTKPYNYSEVCYELGFKAFQDQNFYQSIALNKEGLNVFNETGGKKELDRIYFMESLADAYLATGKFTKAERLLEHCTNYYKKKSKAEVYDYLNAAKKWAVAKTKLGLFDEALSLYTELLMLKLGYLDKHTLMEEKASVFITTGKYDLAEQLYLQILEDMNNPYYIGDVFNTYVYMNLANLYSFMGKHQAAISFSEQAFNAHQSSSLGNKKSTLYAAMQLSMARIYEEAGDPNNAERLYLNAIKTLEKALGTKHRDYGIYLQFCAQFYKEQNNYPKALTYYQTSEKCLVDAVGNEHPEYATVLQEMALVEELMGNYQRATELFIQTTNIWLTQIEINIHGLSEIELTKFYDSFKQNQSVFQSYVMRNHHREPSLVSHMLNLQLATKGFLFETMQNLASFVTASEDLELIQQYAAWKDLKMKVAQIYNATKIGRNELDSDLSNYLVRIKSIEKELTFRTVLFKKKDFQINWKDIQNELLDDEAAVEIVRLQYQGENQPDSVLYIGLLYKNQSEFPALINMGDGSKLEGQLLNRYRNSIKYRITDVLSYQKYWLPIADQLKGISKVYLSPDGAFYTISFCSLYNTLTERYLCDEMDIVLMNNTKSISHKTPAVKNINSATLIGSPDYSHKSSHEEDNGEKWMGKEIDSDTTIRFFQANGAITPLPQTLVEIEKIDAILRESLPATSVYTQNKATENNLRNIVNPSILHIATHGFFLKDKDLHYSQNLAGLNPEELVRSPLLRSGLLMASAQNSLKNGGDGILTAYEAQTLQLDSTELVVLSACETGLGDIKNGEGVYGLNRAFQSAGAKSVMMSLWTVSDKATQEFMLLFYTNWIQDKKPLKEAFKSAQIKLRENYPEPYYWAAFIINDQ